MTSYRLLSYQAKDGPRAGLAVQDRVHDLATLTLRPAYASVLGVPRGLGRGAARARGYGCRRRRQAGPAP